MLNINLVHEETLQPIASVQEALADILRWQLPDADMHFWTCVNAVCQANHVHLDRPLFWFGPKAGSIDAPVLVLQLKRWANRNGSINNCFHAVAIPHSLHFSTSVYELQSVVTHAGDRADHGHYVAWAKYEDSWYLFDDARSREATPMEASRFERDASSGDKPYLLVYTRVGSYPQEPARP